MVRQNLGGTLPYKYRKKCRICGSAIFDRSISAEYCKKHKNIIEEIRSALGNKLTFLRKKYPDLTIIFKVKSRKIENEIKVK